MSPKRKKTRPTGGGDGRKSGAVPAFTGGASNQPAVENSEPVAESNAVPVGLVVLFGILFFWGGLDLDRYGGEFNAKVYEPYATLAEVQKDQPKTGGVSLAEGEEIYMATCKYCHQENGQGAPGQFPPLAGSDWVSAESPTRIIRIVLQGFQGPVKVNGQAFNNAMLAWGKDFSGLYDDSQIASVLSYVRQAWGNKAAPVTPEMVKEIHQKVGSRGARAWTAPELEQIQPGQ